MDKNLEQAAALLMDFNPRSSVIFYDRGGMVCGVQRLGDHVIRIQLEPPLVANDYDLRPAWARWLVKQAARYSIKTYLYGGPIRSIAIEKDNRRFLAVHWGMYFTIQFYSRYWHPIGFNKAPIIGRARKAHHNQSELCT